MTHRVFGEELTVSDVVLIHTVLLEYIEDPEISWVSTLSIQAEKNGDRIDVTREPENLIEDVDKLIILVDKDRLSIRFDIDLLTEIKDYLQSIKDTFTYTDDDDWVTQASGWSCSKEINSMEDVK